VFDKCGMAEYCLSMWTSQDFPPMPRMSEADIISNALSDPDNPPLTEAGLARLTPLPKARALRIRLRLTQEEFAARCHNPLGTLRGRLLGGNF
jgi:putative transcriptional regulator